MMTPESKSNDERSKPAPPIMLNEKEIEFITRFVKFDLILTLICLPTNREPFSSSSLTDKVPSPLVFVSKVFHVVTPPSIMENNFSRFSAWSLIVKSGGNEGQTPEFPGGRRYFIERFCGLKSGD